MRVEPQIQGDGIVEFVDAIAIQLDRQFFDEISNASGGLLHGNPGSC